MSDDKNGELMDFVSDVSDFILRVSRVIHFRLKSAREKASLKIHPKNNPVSVEISVSSG